ncbi:MAG: NADH-quinone oxidoreductase subunit N [Dehalococcoidia bacterium]|nr:NADH-quinone oxidoreductase subunit N [Dehalococcoidia bacterium]
MSIDNFMILLPILTMFTGAIVILLASMFFDKKLMIFTISSFYLAVICFAILNMHAYDSVQLFSNTYLYSDFGSLLIVFFAIIGIVCILFSCLYYNLAEKQLLFGDYAAITTTILGSAMILVHSIDIILMFVALETIAICQYVLVSLPRTRFSAESAIKYLLNGAIATAIFAYGIVFLWGATASTNILDIGLFITNANDSSVAILLFSILLITIGIAFKMGLIPFHGWIPDVYFGGPINVIAFLSTASKGTAFIFFAIFAMFIIGDKPGSLAIWWSGWLSLIGILSMFLGNASALQSTNVKKILAFSSIAHAGYFSLGLVTIILGNSNGLSSVFLYMIAYGCANLLVFFVVILNSQSNNNFSLDSFQGLFYRNKILGIFLTIGLLSLTGIPPFAGFIGKFYLFYNVYNPNYWWTWFLVIFAVLNTVIAAGYYFRWIKIAFTQSNKKINKIHYSNSVYALLFFLGLFTIIIGLYPNKIIFYSNQMSDFLRILLS